MSLEEILAEAVGWQEEAEQVIALCVLPGGKGSILARRTGRVIAAYRELREAVRGLPPSAAQQEVDRLLNFHEQLVTQALLLGYRVDSPGRERVAAHFWGGLGDPGRALRRLHQDAGGPTG
jgi:hypothetical protein